LAPHDVHHGVVHMALGLERPLGRDLHDLQAVVLLVAQPGIAYLPATALPVGQRYGGEVLDRAALVQRRPLAAHELLVRAGDVPLLEGPGLAGHRRAPFGEIERRPRASQWMLEDSARAVQSSVRGVGASLRLAAATAPRWRHSR